ncbi:MULTISPECIES: hypothetical protein [Prochlorococcus]|uniref:hypothetical protein n=1 Tax=Prochlorococcus TaxID=1218 RepID=UPI0007BC5E4E|nr:MULTISPECIES: hypothetical protein [Prochlorococcus]KZR66728.1 hypothetical protein PMIT1312_00855 [Prochlorococcus marinus str. MIT 1312]KZR83157.1 hypothetical protein PMIT1327_00541 [Prochlorococcus marinus str. MIT 1327]NMO84235.1 hypothetical protein [Prochlorococcus sp. P1344]NMP05911.1 hypothetical protein [Prochlorococcus sp. P1361]NMP12937.1 hypothetical protein [Prochlorococcus sp.P1363]
MQRFAPIGINDCQTFPRDLATNCLALAGINNTSKRGMACEPQDLFFALLLDVGCSYALIGECH